MLMLMLTCGYDGFFMTYLSFYVVFCFLPSMTATV